MAELKTTQNDRSVKDFLNGIADEQKRKDCFSLLALMKQVTKKQPRMWGPSIVGFGGYHYKYDCTEILKTWFGWKSVIDLGDITNARGTEMLLPVWVRLYGVLKTPNVNLKVVRSVS